jgi:ubiquinone/menaquinone biosynthesis C-methylase UbiE
MRKTKGGNGEPPKRFPRPLVECGSKLKIEGLVKEAIEFAREDRERGDKLKERERLIVGKYNDFDKHERAYFFSLLYDIFSARYDRHMGVETGHYEAMREVLPFASRYLRAPILDITAGTGELLSFALGLACEGRTLRADEAAPLAASRLLPNLGEGAVVANEISPLMLEIAERKLERFSVALTSYNALSLPANWKFRTVLCSQTMHLLAEDDKKHFVRSIHDVLIPGGHAVVLEEDPFMVSPSESIDGVGLCIRAVACPMKTDALLGMFEVNGFTYTEHRAAHAIDSEHIMRLHVFKKSS